MTIPEKEVRELTDEDVQVIRGVYMRRVGHIRWLVIAAVKGLAVGLALGWITSGVFGSMFLMNLLFWLGLVWGASITTALDARQLEASIAKSILTAPVAFKNELARRSAVVRKDQAELAERMKED